MKHQGVDLKRVSKSKKEKARLKELLVSLDKDKTGKVDFTAYLALSKQLHITYDEIDKQHLQKFFVKKGQIEYAQALRSLYLFNDQTSGQLRWGVQSGNDRESVSQQMSKIKSRQFLLRPSKKQNLSSQLDAEISKLNQSMVDQVIERRKLTPPRSQRQLTPQNRAEVKGFSSVQPHQKNTNPAYNIPRNIQMGYVFGKPKPKRNYLKICQLLAAHEVTFDDLNLIKEVFKKSQRNTGSAFISKEEFRTALPSKFPNAFVQKITPVLHDSEHDAISYALFLDLLNDLMGSASAMKLLGNTSSKMKQVLSPGNQGYIDGKDSKLMAYIQFRIDEKYKTTAAAFKAFDKDHDGLLNFTQFKEGLWDLGIRAGQPEVLRIYNSLEKKVNKGGINLQEFYSLGGSQSDEIIIDLTHTKPAAKKLSGVSELITKSRDPNSFNQDVQNQRSGISKIWRDKMQYVLPSDRNNSFRYGSPLRPHVNFRDLMSHQFEKDFHNQHLQKIEDLLRQDAQKNKELLLQRQVKDTKTSARRAQLMRERSQSPTNEEKPWKLKKYRNIQGKVRNLSVSPSQAESHFKLPEIEGVKYM